MGTVYLVHFSTPLSHARHYLGYTGKESLKSRLDRHKSGHGARLMEVITDLGIPWSVTRTWKGTRQLERQLKKRKSSPALCLVCVAAKKAAKELVTASSKFSTGPLKLKPIKRPIPSA